jgi:hypothetical protein
VLALAAVASAMALVGAGLVLLQATAIHAWCTLCLGSAAASIVAGATVCSGGR